MNKHRGLLIYTTLLVALGGTAGLAWRAATGTFRPPWWLLAVGAVVIALVCDQAEQALERRHNRRAKRAQTRHRKAASR